MRKEFCSYFWSWILLVWKRVFWPVKRLVCERRWNSKVQVEEVGFVDRLDEFDIELAG